VLHGKLNSILKNPFKLFIHGLDIFVLFQTVQAGDTITVTRKISDIYEKQGKNGLMLFVTTEFRFTNQNDALAVNRQTIISCKKSVYSCSISPVFYR
jgi:hydroxyacyl-ACP dehydratase HTD2-like protein with hotdog domain